MNRRFLGQSPNVKLVRFWFALKLIDAATVLRAGGIAKRFYRIARLIVPEVEAYLSNPYPRILNPELTPR
jgi:hypothetical protein